jgi:NAD(P)-dependent dehydrogenase (short-subunit alcohol dehydrogenase family)
MTDQPLVRTYHESTVVVAGGSSGIGLATAKRFIAAGVPRIALLSKNPDRGQAARQAVYDAGHGAATVIHVSVDAHDPVAVQRAVGEVHRQLGSIDVLVNSIAATGFVPDLLHRTPIEDIPGILAAQALPPMHLTRAAWPILQSQNGGCVINVASDAAKLATPGETVFGGAVAAIVMFSRAAAIEGKRNGIRVNVITPSLVSGTSTTERNEQHPFTKKLFEKAAQAATLGVADADDQAATIVFLAGPDAARLTGQAISVNGGIGAA